jgi:nucleotide-binding universal stress UspA family protein
MKTILVITDNSPAAEHAARFALLMAQTLSAKVVLAHNYPTEAGVDKRILAEVSLDEVLCLESDRVFDHLVALNDAHDGLKPEIDEINIANKTDSQLIEFINQGHIWMVIKGMSHDAVASVREINLNSILNRVQCPLMLVPESWSLKYIGRIAYMADLRYCRVRIVRYLEELAGASGADLSIAHLSAKGLPPMAEEYASAVFSEEISVNARYDRLFFNNIRERDMPTAVDVIINGLHTDLLAIVNHRFHFEEIMGRYITNQLPLYITVPLLIFPY